MDEIKKEVKDVKPSGSMFTENVEGTWFLYDEANPNSAEICIGKLTVAEQMEMRKLFMQKKSIIKNLTGKEYKRFEWDDPDIDGMNEYSWKKSIKGWRRVLDGEGKERPCTDEQKLYLMYKVPAFSEWALKCIGIVNKLAEAEAEIELKN